MSRSRIPTRALALHGLGLAVLLTTVSCAPSEGGAKPKGTSAPTKAANAPKAPPKRVDPGDPIFGPQLSIDGEVISNDRLKNYLANSHLGSTLVEAQILQVFIDEEIERRRAAGLELPPKVSDADIQATLDQAEQEIDEQYGTDKQLADLLTHSQKKFLNLSVRINKNFDRLFLPANPNDWPDVTTEALSTGSLTPEFVQQMKTNWQPPKDDEPAGNDLMQQLFRQDVVSYLKDHANIKTAEDGLPDSVVVSVNGHDVLVDEVWKEIEDLVTIEDVKQAKQWIVNTTLARKALEEKGFWLDDVTYKARYAAEHEPMADSPFNKEALSVPFLRFPNVEAYKTYKRLMYGFQDMIQDEITDEVLESRVDRMDFFIGGRLDVDILLVSAYDFEKKEWKPDGWRQGQKKAEQIMKELSQGLDWDEAMDKYSDFVESPVAKSEAEQYKPKNKGRFRGISRAELRDQLEEWEYITFLNSASVTDFVFFLMEANATSQPLIGRYGFYIPRSHKRVLTSRTIDLMKPEHRDLVVQEYVQSRFNEWIFQLRREADIRGLPLEIYGAY